MAHRRRVTSRGLTARLDAITEFAIVAFQPHILRLLGAARGVCLVLESSRDHGHDIRRFRVEDVFLYGQHHTNRRGRRGVSATGRQGLVRCLLLLYGATGRPLACPLERLDQRGSAAGVRARPAMVRLLLGCIQSRCRAW